MQPIEEGLLLACGQGDRAQADLAAIGGGQQISALWSVEARARACVGESFDPLPLRRCLSVTHKA